MRLYNFTPIPDNLLCQLLKKAAIFVGVEDIDIAVRVVSGKNYNGNVYTEGEKSPSGWANIPQSSGAKFKITCRVPMNKKHGIYKNTDFDMHRKIFVLSLYQTMVHEFQHVYDKLAGMEFDPHTTPYKKRAQEISAYKRQEEATASFDRDPELKGISDQIQAVVTASRRWRTVRT